LFRERKKKSNVEIKRGTGGKGPRLDANLQKLILNDKVPQEKGGNKLEERGGSEGQRRKKKKEGPVAMEEERGSDRANRKSRT